MALSFNFAGLLKVATLWPLPFNVVALLLDGIFETFMCVA
jgi:hypothetical protein